VKQRAVALIMRLYLFNDKQITYLNTEIVADALNRVSIHSIEVVVKQPIDRSGGYASLSSKFSLS